MTSRLPVPTAISAAAQKMLRDAPEIAARSMERSALAQRRRDTFDLYAPEGMEAIRALGGAAAEQVLGGVRVQSVTPKVLRGDRVILYFFGGGFVQGSPEEDLAITALLADETGARILAPYYRLAPEHPCPAALEDALAVYRALAEEKGIEAITVMGESAGAGLALSLVLQASQAGLAMPGRLVLLSPWCDLSKTGDTLTTLEGRDPSLHYELTLAGPAMAYAGGRDLKDPLVSPLYAEFPATLPKTLITTGTRDLFLSDCARLSTKMRGAGIDCDLRVWEGMWHVFEYYLALPEARASLKEIAAFIER
jgi:monoterpene epsilon-lactone hydrolase